MQSSPRNRGPEQATRSIVQIYDFLCFAVGVTWDDLRSRAGKILVIAVALGVLASGLGWPLGSDVLAAALVAVSALILTGAACEDWARSVSDRMNPTVREWLNLEPSPVIRLGITGTPAVLVLVGFLLAAMAQMAVIGFSIVLTLMILYVSVAVVAVVYRMSTEARRALWMKDFTFNGWARTAIAYGVFGAIMLSSTWGFVFDGLGTGIDIVADEFREWV